MTACVLELEEWEDGEEVWEAELVGDFPVGWTDRVGVSDFDGEGLEGRSAGSRTV
jgi:hypothetical protein